MRRFSRMMVFGVLVGAAALPLPSRAATPTVAAPGAVDAPVLGPATFDQQESAVAFGNGVFVVLWRDGNKLVPSEGFALVARRYTAAGAPVSETELPTVVVPATGESRGALAVAFDGTDFIAAWEGEYQGTQAIFRMRFAASATEAPRALEEPVAIDTGFVGKPAIAAGDGHSMIVWTYDADIRGIIKTPTTETSVLTIRSGFSAPPLDDAAGRPSVAWGGTTANNFIVGYEQFLIYFTARAAVVDLTGSVVDDVAISSGIAFNVSAVSDGSQYVLAFDDGPAFTGGRVIRIARVSFAGALLSAYDAYTSADPMSYDAVAPQITVLTGGKIALMWHERTFFGGGALFGGRLTDATSGTLEIADPGLLLSDIFLETPLPAGGANRRTTLASSGALALGSYDLQSSGVTRDDVYVARIGVDDTTFDSTPDMASVSRNFQNHVAIGGDGAYNLVIWEDSRNYAVSGLDLWGQVLDVDGNAVTTSFVVCDEPGDQFYSAVSALKATTAGGASGRFLIAWTDGRTLGQLGGSLEIAGAIVDVSSAVAVSPLGLIAFTPDVGGPLPLGSAQLAPSIAGDEHGWLVTFEDWRRQDFLAFPSLWSVYVQENGTIEGPPVVLQDSGAANSTACNASSTHVGDTFLIAYEVPCSLARPAYLGGGAINKSDVIARWIQIDATTKKPIVAVSDSDPNALNAPFFVARGGGENNSPAVAARGDDEAVLVYHLESTGDAVRARRYVTHAKVPIGSLDVDVSVTPHAALSVGVAKDSPRMMFVTWLQADAVKGYVAPSDLSEAGQAFNLTPLGAQVFFPTTDVTTNTMQPSGQYVVSSTRSVPIAPIAVSANGKASVALEQTIRAFGRDVSRVFTTRLGVQPQGGGCTDNSQCGFGFCTGGVCCNERCDGLCQACSVNGCVETPSDDQRCGGGRCADLSSDCRTYIDDQESKRCVAFGLCAENGAVECNNFEDKADGTGCTLAGCTQAQCGSGVCICTGETVPIPSGDNFTPDGKRIDPGCAYVGVNSASSSNAAWLVFASLLAFAWSSRRRLARASSSRRARTTVVVLFGALTLSACDKAPQAIRFELNFEQLEFENTVSSRVIVSIAPTDSKDTRAFVASEPVVVETGLTIRNADVDGDGRNDMIVDIGADYKLKRSNRFEIATETLAERLPLSVRAESFNLVGNRIARLGGNDSENERVSTTINPGEVTDVPALSPACINQCTGAPVEAAVSRAGQSVVSTSAVSALTSGVFSAARGSKYRPSDLIIGSSSEARGQEPNTGRIDIFFGNRQGLAAAADVTVLGESRGAQAGEALAVGDVDGDGFDDLVVGSPGADDNRGAVYVVYGRERIPSSIDLRRPVIADPTREVRIGRVGGLAIGDRLGNALALIDSNGDGKSEILAGAPGAATVYLLTSTDLPLDATVIDLATVAHLRGETSSLFGRALAASAEGGFIAVGAPVEHEGNLASGAVYVGQVSLVNAPALTARTLSRIVGAGGGFGSGLEFARLSRANTSAQGDWSLIATAPAEGTGRAYVIPTSSPPATAAAIERSVRSLSSQVSQLGASIARLPIADGDGIVLGAPSDSTGAGTAVVLRAQTFSQFPNMFFDEALRPAALSVPGSRNRDNVGSHVLVGDFNLDGFSDIAVGAANIKTVYIIQGPVL